MQARVRFFLIFSNLFAYVIVLLTLAADFGKTDKKSEGVSKLIGTLSF